MSDQSSEVLDVEFISSRLILFDLLINALLSASDLQEEILRDVKRQLDDLANGADETLARTVQSARERLAAIEESLD